MVKKQYNSFLSVGFFFFFNIQGLTENDKTDSNKKCTELEDVGNLSYNILSSV